MKNVLLIGSELGKGGAERSISLLSFYLEPYYNVTLCILSGTDREKFYKTCSNVVFIDPPAAKNIFQKVNAWKYRLKKIRQLKKQLDIDVSISFLEGPDYINVLTKGKEKVVLSIRGSKVHDKVPEMARAYQFIHGSDFVLHVLIVDMFQHSAAVNSFCANACDGFCKARKPVNFLV